MFLVMVAVNARTGTFRHTTKSPTSRYTFLKESPLNENFILMLLYLITYYKEIIIHGIMNKTFHLPFRDTVSLIKSDCNTIIAIVIL